MFFVPCYYPYEVIQNNQQAIVIKADPSCFNASVRVNQPLSSNATISFNTNYSWKKQPIGYLMDNNKFLYSILNPKYDYVRPCAGFDFDNKPYMFLGKYMYKENRKKYNLQLIIQAGPTLIKDGKICILLSKERFRSDVARKTRQMSIGITATNKLIILYSYAWKLDKISNYMFSLGCINAMKLDGGSMASLRLKPPNNDQKTPHIYVGNRGNVVAQICLYLKEKPPTSTFENIYYSPISDLFNYNSQPFLNYNTNYLFKNY